MTRPHLDAAAPAAPADLADLAAPAASAELPDPRLDTILDDRFHLLDYLGAGGMGVVYRAVQLSVGREVALKIMSRMPSDLANERFLREARLASRLSHASIVITHDCGRTADGELWIAMELLHGRSLRQVLEDGGALPLPRVLAIAEQIAAALAAAHDAGIIHRDIKPSNVMILDGDHAKLLDFGLARTDRSEDATLTRSGVVCGTPAYLAPEVALGGAATARSDVYGLGLLLHEMLAGAHPFAAATPEAQVSRTLNEAPPRLTTVPDAVAEVVHRLLVRNPDERCPSAAIARQWIAAVRAGRAPPRRRLPRRGLRRVAVAIAAVAVAAVGLAYRPAPRAMSFHGSYLSVGNPSCSHGTAWMRIDGDRVTGGATSDVGQSFHSVGTYRPSGTIFGAFTLGDHAVGSFDGELTGGHARGTTSDYVYGCTGSFDLTRDP
jgi:serine/threonine-protein kinase